MLFHLGDKRYHLKDFDKARDAFEKGYRIDPVYDLGVTHLAQLYLLTLSSPEALAKVEIITETLIKQKGIHSIIANAYVRADSIDRGIASFERTVESRDALRFS